MTCPKSTVVFDPFPFFPLKPIILAPIAAFPPTLSPSDVSPSSDCEHELLAVHRALRLALCTPPPPGRQGDGPGDHGSAKALLPGLGLAGRRAAACLLVGHLVESGVPGWEETKAAMVPPPDDLVEAAETLPETRGACGLPESSG